MTRVDSPVSLMQHDPDRSWITDPDPDHPKGTHPKTREMKYLVTVNGCDSPVAMENKIAQVQPLRYDALVNK